VEGGHHISIPAMLCMRKLKPHCTSDEFKEDKGGDLHTHKSEGNPFGENAHNLQSG
jgi:hypothetical protein